MSALSSAIPNPNDVLAMGPEDLAGILIEIVAHALGSRFLATSFTDQSAPYTREYAPAVQEQVLLAVAEAMSWMETQGIIVRDPGQPVEWYVLTRRGRQIRSRVDLDAYQRAGVLPRALLQSTLSEKVYPMFARGDHDTAVFQAFKEIEVAVRDTAVRMGSEECAFLYGRELMQRAFHPENGPLTDKSLPAAERQSEMSLFVGAIGHAKNPTSHREVNLTREEAAKLIVFASYLLDRVEKRSV